MNDYLNICYSNENRPYTTYPIQLARHLFHIFNMNNYNTLLEVGCGRGEILREFKILD
jgi:cyclopropane fatty-acyl-phospholipid synthase-like methyltransferase